MAMLKKGSRPIVVNGQKYRWRIRRQPTYCQGNGWGNTIVAVEQFIEPEAMLIIDTGRIRLDAWVRQSGGIGVTPKEVAQGIRDAIADGWKPAERGPQFQYILRNVLAEQAE